VELTFSQLLSLVDGEVLQESSAILTGMNTLGQAGPGDLSFFGNERYIKELRSTKAAVVLVPTGFTEELVGRGVVAVDNPSVVFAEIMKRFTPPPREFRPGVHPTAAVDASVKFDLEQVCIGPYVVIESGVTIGPGTEIGAFSFIGQEAQIGEHCLLFPRVSVMNHCVLGDRVRLHSGVVIGGDGFGYEFVNGQHVKIDQVGIVQIDQDVEIGANTTIDRARFGRTWIGEGTKIDNQVMIAHNCVIGRHCIIIAQAGIAGSTQIGDYAIIAAQAGVAGHLEIGSKVVVAAQAGVTKSLLQPGQYMGFPATPVREMREVLVTQRRLPNLLQRVKVIEQQLEALCHQPNQPPSVH
jgi:UDP-3-O-[3-hydroxymyristoyl] glucosamine N-acyltransferase